VHTTLTWISILASSFLLAADIASCAAPILRSKHSVCRSVTLNLSKASAQILLEIASWIFSFHLFAIDSLCVRTPRSVPSAAPQLLTAISPIQYTSIRDSGKGCKAHTTCRLCKFGLAAHPRRIRSVSFFYMCQVLPSCSPSLISALAEKISSSQWKSCMDRYSMVEVP